MAPNADSSSSSPKPVTSQTKIHDGRIEKPRMRRSESKTPNYSIAGRTFACQSCKKGHRVSKCTHALERPVHMTNDPGRPSADQKRHCDCPRTCSCTKKNCKCARNCVCTQVMYMLVHVPIEKHAETAKAPSGEWQIDREVITDLKGNALSEAQIQERVRLKSMQKTESDGVKVEDTGFRPLSLPVSSISSVTADASPASTLSTSTKSCCQHKKAIENATAAAMVSRERDEKPVPDANRPRCNCGSDCSCAFCLEHPNNTTSQRMLKQQAAHFVEQGFIRGVANWQPYANSQPFSNMSCMGTNPRFAMHSQPNPSSAELQGIFGDSGTMQQGYYLSYPITGPSWTSQAVNPAVPIDSGAIAANFSTGAPIFHEDNLSIPHPMGSDFGHHDSFLTSQGPVQDFMNLPAPEPSQFSYQTANSPMEVGNASVKFDDGLDKWPDPSMLWTSPKWLSNEIEEQVLQAMQDIPTADQDLFHVRSGPSIQEAPIQDHVFNYTQQPPIDLSVPITPSPHNPQFRFSDPRLPLSSPRSCCQQTEPLIPNIYDLTPDSMLNFPSPTSGQAA